MSLNSGKYKTTNKENGGMKMFSIEKKLCQRLRKKFIVKWPKLPWKTKEECHWMI